MKKLLLIIFLVCDSPQSFASESNLACSAQLETSVNGRLVTTKKGPLEVRIIQRDDSKRLIAMLTNGLFSIGVVSEKSQNVYEVTDLSVTNIWWLRNKHRYSSDQHFKEDVVDFQINRSTGSIQITVRANAHDGRELYSKINGNCEKVDTNKKKF
jgi:hypothetical protein